MLPLSSIHRYNIPINYSHVMLTNTFGTWCRVQNTAADWIEANLEGGPVVKEKFMGSSNWSSAYIYTTQAGQEYFVKLAMGGRDDSMFQGEAQGLQAMYGKQMCV